jgi:acyl-CoA thioester hydrolase
MDMLFQLGLSPQKLAISGVGVILMEESCKFRRELKWGDEITMQSNWEPNGPRGEDHLFSFTHKIYKASDVFCAEIQILGGWMDLEERKLCAPPADIKSVIDESMA